MNTTVIYYSPEGGSVNKVAMQLAELIGNEKTDIFHVKEVEATAFQQYTQILLVGSTVGEDHWSNESIENEWHTFFTTLEDISFEGKKVAIAGLGNGVFYPEHFADGIAHLHKLVSDKKAEVCAYVKNEGYEFSESEALNDDGYFCGLPIDEDNEEHLTEERLKNWIEILKKDFAL